MKRFFTVVLALTAACALAGCSEGDETSQPTSANTASKIGSSLQAVAAQRVAEESDSMAPEQLAMVQEAAQGDGSVSLGTYKAAWSNYDECLVDLGYQKPAHREYDSGLVGNMTMMDLDGLTDDERTKVMTDESSCKTQYVMYVDELYRASVGNQSLYSSTTEGAVQCLKDKGIAGADYAAKQLEQEMDRFDELFGEDEADSASDAFQHAAQAFSFDVNDGAALTCLVANGIDLVASTQLDEAWKPLG